MIRQRKSKEISTGQRQDEFTTSNAGDVVYMRPPYKELNSYLGELFVCSAHESCIKIRTPFLYPDGDVIDLYYDEQTETLTDLAETNRWLRMQTVFDDTVDMWASEDFKLLDSLSKIARWSRPDEFERILRKAD